jgi:cell division protein FtsW
MIKKGTRKGVRITLGWWSSLDKHTMIAAVGLMISGLILVISSSPAIANKIGLSTTYFIYRQISSVLLGLAIMVLISLISEGLIKRLVLPALALTFLMLLVVPFLGHATKGAKRWLRVAGIFVQPSELLKPCMIVFSALMLDLQNRSRNGNFRLHAIVVLLAIEILLLMQPDVGTSIIFALTFCFQLFVSGMPIVLVLILCGAFLLSGALAYIHFPHISYRVQKFLSLEPGYQVARALDAFKNGGILGVGLGEGRIKESIPDSHTDFIFAVAGEEMGVIFCLIIAVTFLFIASRNLQLASSSENCFKSLSISGLAFSMCSQAGINLSVNLNLMPTKGMTLPLLSYGGSSIVASCLSVGLILALSRKRNENIRYQLKHFNV